MTPDGDTFDNDEATHDWVPGDATRPASATPEEAPPRSPAPAAAPSRLLGRFELLELLGRGGMGEVYRAVHTHLKKQVAVKILPADRMSDPQAVARFRREIRLASELSHPNLVRFENAGEADGVHYLVMEYTPGVDLEQLVRRLGPLFVADACQLVGQAAVGLEHAHRRGLVHRDIKPSNLMLSTSGAVKILDFGVARLKDATEELTASNRTLGTVEYLAPEQAQDSGAVDGRADIYSLGCTLFKLLTGRTPFEGEGDRSPQQIVLAHVNQPPPSVLERRSDVPAELAAVIDRMLAKNPADRYSTPAAAAAALAPFAAGCDVPALLQQVDLTAAAEAHGAAAVDTAEYLRLAPTDSVAAVTPEAPISLHVAAARRPRRRTLAALAGLALLGACLAAFLIPWRSAPKEKESLAPPPTAPLATLDWNTARWPDPLVLSREFAFDDVTVTVSLPQGLPYAEAAELPHKSSNFQGGLQSVEETLVLAADWAPPLERLRVTLRFSAAVKDVAFRLFDVDRTPGRSSDRVQVLGYLGNREVRPTLRAGPANRVDAAESMVVGVAAVVDVGAASAESVAAVEFAEAIDRVELQYIHPATHEEANAETPQIALHDVRFTVDRPFGAMYTLDWDKVNWRQARTASFTAGGVDVAVSLSGLHANNAARRSGLSNSAALTGGNRAAPANLLWQVQRRGAHEVSTVAFDFASPVKDLRFTLYDVDAAGDGYADRVSVFGLHHGQAVLPRMERAGRAAAVRVDTCGIAAAWLPRDYARRLAATSTESTMPLVTAVGAAPAADYSDAGNVTVQFDGTVDRVVLVFGVERQNDETPQLAEPSTRQVALSQLQFRKASANDKPRVAHAPRVIVPATANPYLAGAARGTTLGADAAPGESPVEVRGVKLSAGAAVSFSVTGATREDMGPLLRGPDGGNVRRLPAKAPKGFVGHPAPLMALVGVFLGADESAPTSKAASAAGAANLASGEDLIAPALGEVFFVGDGRSEDGQLQRFIVPARAARLFLGVMDGKVWCDNAGALEVEAWVEEAIAAPQAEARGEKVDLFALLTPARDAIDGHWEVDDNGATFRALEDQRAIVQVPFVPPDEYLVELIVERVGGEGSFGVGLPLAGKTCLLVLDHHGESGFWRSTAEQRGIPAPDSTLRLPKGQRVALTVAVERDVVRANHPGGALVIDRNRTDDYALHANDLAFYNGVPFLHNEGSQFRVHRFALTPLADKGRPITLASDNAPPERRAAETALWKGGQVRISLAGATSGNLTRLDDLPPVVELYGISDRVAVRGIALTDADLAVLGQVKELRALGLARARISDAGVAHLASLPHLELLVLNYTSVTDAGVGRLRGLTRLKSLMLVETLVGDAGLTQLRGLPGLERLGVSGTQTSDAGLVALAPALQNATWLCLCNTKVTGAVLPHLARLEHLQTLHLGNATLGDEDLPQLYGLENLKELRLAGTAATPAGILELQRQMPSVKIVK